MFGKLVVRPSNIQNVNILQLQHLNWLQFYFYLRFAKTTIPQKLCRRYEVNVFSWRPLKWQSLVRGNRAGLDLCQQYLNMAAHDWTTVLVTDESRFRFHPYSRPTRVRKRMWYVRDMFRKCTYTPTRFLFSNVKLRLNTVL